MKITEKLYHSGETSFILRRALGPLRSWDDCLTDMRLEKTDVCGFVLLPAGKQKDRRSLRPLYALSAIKEFIRAVWAAESEARVNTPEQGVIAEFDPDLHWRVQKIVASPPPGH